MREERDTKRDKRGREKGIIQLHEGWAKMDERKRGMMRGETRAGRGTQMSRLLR